MGMEIERKFLVTSDAWKSGVTKQVNFRQGYMSGSELSSVRVRVDDDHAHLNIKSATLGVSRQEFDYEIPLADAHKMLDTLCQKPLIEKTRYYVPFGRHLWEIDVFKGDNEGLVVAEIELSSEEEAFEKPSWLGEEVSHDKRYYNVCLVKHPFKDW